MKPGTLDDVLFPGLNLVVRQAVVADAGSLFRAAPRRVRVDGAQRGPTRTLPILGMDAGERGPVKGCWS
jgi:hypothetical protein